MKKAYSLIVATMLVSALVFSYGCGKKKTIKKNFNLEVQVDFPIDATGSTTYDDLQILDASAQASDFAKHKEDVISVVLDSVKYYTREYVIPNDNNLQINNASLKIGAVGGNDEVTIGQLQNVNLMGVYEEPAMQKLTLDNGGIAKFADRLTKDPYTAQIRLQGDVNNPVNFKIRARFYFTFAAWIL